MRKFSSLRTLIVLVGILIAVGFAAFYKPTKTSNGCDVRFGDQCITLERATTKATRERGLSGRKDLPRNKGMLFVFDKPGPYCFWMKDMHFPIDIVWLDANNNIVGIEQDVRQNTYPDSFCSKQNAKHVIEVNSGIIKDANLKLGDRLEVHGT